MLNTRKIQCIIRPAGASHEAHAHAHARTCTRTRTYTHVHAYAHAHTRAHANHADLVAMRLTWQLATSLHITSQSSRTLSPRFMYWGDFDKAWLLTGVQPLNTNNPQYVQQMLEYVKRHHERPFVVFACSEGAVSYTHLTLPTILLV